MFAAAHMSLHCRLYDLRPNGLIASDDMVFENASVHIPCSWCFYDQIDKYFCLKLQTLSRMVPS